MFMICYAHCAHHALVTACHSLLAPLTVGPSAADNASHHALVSAGFDAKCCLPYAEVREGSITRALRSVFREAAKGPCMGGLSHRERLQAVSERERE
jgi:hypothetical protein